MSEAQIQQSRWKSQLAEKIIKHFNYKVLMLATGALSESIVFEYDNVDG